MSRQFLYDCIKVPASTPHQRHQYGYEVFKGDVHFGHTETRTGSRVEGEYHVLLPTGYRQVSERENLRQEGHG